MLFTVISLRSIVSFSRPVDATDQMNAHNEGKVFIWNIEKDDSKWQFAKIYQGLLLEITKTLFEQFAEPKIPESQVLQLSESVF